MTLLLSNCLIKNHVNLCLSASLAMLFVYSTICCLVELCGRSIFTAFLPLFHIFFYSLSFTFQDNSETILSENYKQFLHFLGWFCF